MRVNKMDAELIVSINSKYSEMLDGLPTIRAYKKMTETVHTFWQKLNIYSMAAMIRNIADGKLKLIMLGSINILACLSLLFFLFVKPHYQPYVVFLIFNYFGLEDSVIRLNVSINAFSPRL